ncbi:hypothetical protein BRADI_4g10158v3 [Brachypodium distachyon]|uniref:Secreted peptide n=1 Tax=Brachypodium distachyon TaxID=15368 RepID=A0A0Q3PDJ8_BRADI|nr:hypothetical protein BRADI_4g10158v3 [Brachypodium distachyon]
MRLTLQTLYFTLFLCFVLFSLHCNNAMSLPHTTHACKKRRLHQRVLRISLLFLAFLFLQCVICCFWMCDAGQRSLHRIRTCVQFCSA